MQLISLPVSPFAARVRIAIYAKNLNIDLQPPPLDWPTARQFRNVNPIGRIPVLILEDGSAIQESWVILEYLEERFPHATSLLPRGVRERAKVRLLGRMVDLYLMPSMVALARAEATADERNRRVEELFDGLAAVEALMEDNIYAADQDLSLADCALAPALFAARVTGERLQLDLLGSYPRVGCYAEVIPHNEHVGRVLVEMEDGLRRLSSVLRS